MGYVYKVTNLLNNKVYIGITTKTIEERWKRHIDTAYTKNSKDYNQVFKKAIRRYGESNFKIEEIEEQEDLELLKQREQYWISYYKSYYELEDSWGYNGTPGGDMPAVKTRPVYQLNIMTGEIVDEYPSVAAAEQIYGRGIYEICHEKIIGEKPQGFTWCFKENLKNNSQDFLKIKYKVFCQLDLNGKLISYWRHHKEAGEAIGCSPGNIGSCLIGKRQSAGGFQWCYYKDLDNFLNKKYINLNSKKRQKKVAQYDLNNNLIKIWESASIAAKETNTNISKISAVCHGKQKTSNGFKWKYIEKNGGKREWAQIKHGTTKKNT